MNISLIKFWYKITNKQKHKDYKIFLKKKEDIKIFKEKFEKQINNIQQKIKDKNELSFLHSGHSGDIINSLPVINAGSDIQICIGDSIQLNASGGNSYQWSPAGSLTNAIIADPIAFPTDTTDYIVTSADTNGCVSSDTVSVIVNPLPDANAGFNVNICEGDHAFLNASGGVLYQWSPSAFLNHDTVADPLAFPDTSIIFNVDVTDSNGCTASDSMIVIVFMVYTVDDQYICEGDSVQLDVFGEPGVSFSWSPVTGLSDPNIINPWASPTSTTLSTAL